MKEEKNKNTGYVWDEETIRLAEICAEIIRKNEKLDEEQRRERGCDCNCCK